MWRGELAIVIAVLACPACKPSDATPGSCTRDRDGACTEYGADRALAGKRMCAGFTWREGASTCPAENRLGTCTKEGGRVTELLYAGPPNHFTADAAKSACASAGGQWAALPSR